MYLLISNDIVLYFNRKKKKMKFLILILFTSQLLSQDIGQKMIDNGDFDSALNYYKYLLENEKLSKDDIIFNLTTIY